MGKHIHRLSDVILEEKTAVCSTCGPVSIKIKGVTKYNSPILRCHNAYKANKMLRYRPWAFYKKDVCEKCGFVPEHSSQLEVDHIDGNRENNDPGNLQTLCANCHRLKTYINKDWLTLNYR